MKFKIKYVTEDRPATKLHTEIEAKSEPLARVNFYKIYAKTCKIIEIIKQ